MAEAEILEQHSRKLNVVIALLLHILLEDQDFAQKKRKGTGDLAVFCLSGWLSKPQQVAIEILRSADLLVLG